MSQELIRTRCKQGKLIITDEAIRTELPLSGGTQTLYRSALIGIDSKLVVPSIFGLGGGVNLIFHGAGAQDLRADYVGMKDAKAIMQMLQPPGK